MYVHGVKDISKETGFWTQMELYTRRHTTLLGGMDLLFFLSAGSGSENLIPRGKFSNLLSLGKGLSIYPRAMNTQ